MSDDLAIQNSAISNLDSSYTTQSTTTTESEADVTKTEFLQLLVTQLKNQDPLNPMENEDFAVDLAQFSQLEQLIDINDNLSNSSSTGTGVDISSMAAYLGHEVLLDLSTVKVNNGDAGTVDIKLEQDAANVTVDLVDADGNVVASLGTGAMTEGTHKVALTGLDAMDGEYELKVSALSENGLTTTPSVEFGGVVTGFVPGPEPVLLVDGREVSPGDIKEVRVASQQG